MEIIKHLADTPLPTILVIAGIAFLFIAIGGSLGAAIVTTLVRRDLAAFAGSILLVTGVALWLVPGHFPIGEEGEDRPGETTSPGETNPPRDTGPTGGTGPELEKQTETAYSSCADVRDKLGSATDGTYALKRADGLTFEIYCAGMGPGQTPKEYLPLARTSPQGQRTANYSTYYIGAQHAGQTCPCEGPVVARFTHVRLILDTMTIDTRDQNLAELDYDHACFALHAEACNYRPWGYGIAASCAGNFDTRGEANINLRGTPFKLASTHQFRKEEDPSLGFTSAGEVVSSDEMLQVFTLRGGGDCGAFGALDGLQLTR